MSRLSHARLAALDDAPRACDHEDADPTAALLLRIEPAPGRNFTATAWGGQR